MTEIYKLIWTCANCNQENTMNRTKYQAAFEHSPVLPPCKKCGGSGWASRSCAMPNVDIELLETWYADPELYFIEQDEDLIIANSDIEVLKKFLSNADDKIQRASTLGNILAVKLYDNTFDTTQDRDWCINWLRTNKDMWISETPRYITKKINPILESNYKN